VFIIQLTKAKPSQVLINISHLHEKRQYHSWNRMPWISLKHQYKNFSCQIKEMKHKNVKMTATKLVFNRSHNFYIVPVMQSNHVRYYLHIQGTTFHNSVKSIHHRYHSGMYSDNWRFFPHAGESMQKKCSHRILHIQLAYRQDFTGFKQYRFD
jgi:hypothetical protein